MNQFFFRTTIVLSASALCLSLTGCDYLGFFADRASGTTIKAKYEPKSQPMLVLVESYKKELDSGIEVQHLTTDLNTQMTTNKISPVVPVQKLEQLRDADPEAYSKPMPIAEIGRRVGARQVLYVNVNDVEVMAPAGSGQVRGQMKAVVRMVDAGTGDNLWPLDAPSEAVSIETPWKVVDSNFSQNDLRALMADQLAQHIADLFHDTHPDQEPMDKSQADQSTMGM